MVDYDEFTKAVTRHTMNHQKDMAEIKMEKKEIEMLTDQKRLLERMNVFESIAVAVIGFLLIGAIISLVIQSGRLTEARGTINELNERLAVAIDRSVRF